MQSHNNTNINNNINIILQNNSNNFLPSATTVAAMDNHGLNQITTTTTTTTTTTMFSRQQEDLSNLPELRARVRGHVEQAIQLMSPAETEAYQEACSKCRNLVETESDALQFVRYCDYDIWSAAKRLCRYWKERKEIFGADRAFLPLICTGLGALTKEDAHTLQAGFPSMLPDSHNGHKVILFDRRKWLPTTSSLTKIRCFWYCCNLVMQDDTGRAQRDNGVAFLILQIAQRSAPLDHKYLTKTSTLMAEALPIRAKFHVSAVPSSNSRQLYSMQDFMSSCLHYTMDKMGMSHFEVHIEREKGQIAEELQDEPLRLSTAGIPFDIGGEWKVESMFKWVREREALERRKYPELLFRVENQKQLLEERGKAVSHKSKEELEQERLEKRRLADLMHSRRKRERKRQHVNSLKEEWNRLMGEKSNLETEESRLKELVLEAQRLVSTLP